MENAVDSILSNFLRRKKLIRELEEQIEEEERQQSQTFLLLDRD